MSEDPRLKFYTSITAQIAESSKLIPPTDILGMLELVKLAFFTMTQNSLVDNEEIMRKIKKEMEH